MFPWTPDGRVGAAGAEPLSESPDRESDREFVGKVEAAKQSNLPVGARRRGIDLRQTTQDRAAMRYTAKMLPKLLNFGVN